VHHVVDHFFGVAYFLVHYFRKKTEKEKRGESQQKTSKTARTFERSSKFNLLNFVFEKINIFIPKYESNKK
jgi:hypothetical protein